jgi:hypothetical protein
MIMRLSVAFSVIALLTVAACFGGHVDAGSAAAPFVCPKDATTPDPQKWVKNFGGGRGSVWCDDGATATVKVSVGPSPLTFKGGVCTSATTGTFISIGAVVSENALKASDPPGFKTLKWNKKTGTPEAVAFSRPGKFYWSDEVKITWNGLSGSWSGSDGQWINNKFAEIKASAKFTCKRIVKTKF